MTLHQLKSWPEFYEPVAAGKKRFELRKNDRNYMVGDKIDLREYDDRAGKYTGRRQLFTITYVLDGIGPGAITPLHGLLRGYVILSLEPIQDNTT